MACRLDIRAKCRHRKWTFQHTAHLKKERRLHQARHVAPNAPNSRDPNPVDYAVCGVLQQRVYHRRKFNTVEELERAIITECKNYHNVSLPV